MAFLPCSYGPHLNPYRNSTWYVARGGGIDLIRFRLRLCPQHSAAVQKNLAEFKVDAESLATGWNGSPAQCLTCDQPIVETGDQVFVTGYPAQDQREDYWSRVHRDCQLPLYLRPEA